MHGDEPRDPDCEDDGTAVIAGEVRPLTTTGWPQGYVYGATRYADVILEASFPERCRDLREALRTFRPTLDELRSGGGGRTVFVARFDASLAAMHDGAVWGKRNVTIEKSLSLDGASIRMSRTRGHEIDMFGLGSETKPLPGIAVEMEWNNKDPFFDRDLNSFQALHHEGAIAVGVIVTRGPELQHLIAPTIRSKDGGFKYGQSTTHWDKLIPKVNLGGGGECPLLLIGIQNDRISGIELALEASLALRAAAELKANWRSHHRRWADARPQYEELVWKAREIMPPLRDERDSTD